MNKRQLLEQIAEETGLTQGTVDQVISSFCDIIGNTIKMGESVRLIGFGTFTTKERKARIGINPITMEKINIPEATIPVFKAGSKLKDVINK